MAKREREKAIARAANKDRRPQALVKYIRIPSSKIEIVLDLVRGKDYEVAVNILKNTNKSACAPILKVLNSAAANAENNLNIMKDSLYVAECWSMACPTLKRMMPRARGRADRILKRTSHIQIILDERKEKEVVMKTKAQKEGKEPKQTKATKSLAKAVDIPETQGERPLAPKPNVASKPLGTKKPAAVRAEQKSKAESTVKKGAKK